jgi:hypothetical protein
MQEYRAYVLDSDGYVKGHIQFFACDDRAAVAYARQSLDGHDTDVLLTRVVAKLVPTAH